MPPRTRGECLAALMAEDEALQALGGPDRDLLLPWLWGFQAKYTHDREGWAWGLLDLHMGRVRGRCTDHDVSPARWIRNQLTPDVGLVPGLLDTMEAAAAEAQAGNADARQLLDRMTGHLGLILG